jgi:hypothetical protein
MATPASIFGLDLDGSAYGDSIDSLDDYFVPRHGYLGPMARPLDDDSSSLDHDDDPQPPDASLILKVSITCIRLSILADDTSSLISKGMRFDRQCATRLISLVVE